MKNLNKMSSEQLRSKYFKCITVQDRTDRFYALQDKISAELDRRNRAAIFKEACRVLENRNFSNQFAAAANYADAVISGSDYFNTDTCHEIDSYYTKKGMGAVVVYFD